MRSQLNLVTDTTEDRIRSSLAYLAEFEAAAANERAVLATLARIYADERGETMRPTISDLKRRVGL